MLEMQREDLQVGNLENPKTLHAQIGIRECFSLSLMIRAFAANIGVKFQTPEEFFLNEEPAKFIWDSIDPLEIVNKYAGQKYNPKDYISKAKEMIIMVGMPASGEGEWLHKFTVGKSSFTKNILVPNGYARVNRVNNYIYVVIHPRIH